MIETNPMPQSTTEAADASKSRSSASFRVLVGVGLGVGLILRLIGLHYPPYDSHHFRQCQTLSTIDDFYRNGINLVHPHTLYMGYPGVFVLELPLFQAIGASVYHLFGAHLEIIRALNILFGTISAWVLYLLTVRLLTREIAALSTLVYWLAPLNILYHRSTLLDPMAVLCGLSSFYSLTVLLDDGPPQAERNRRWVYFSIFIVATLLTALIKALYLWPAVLLLGRALLLRRFRFSLVLLGILGTFAVAGLCFLYWSRYAAHVNATNPVTGGINPATLLGISKLWDLHFYSMMLKTRPKEWLGLAAGVFYLFGLWACRVEWQKVGWRSPLLFIALAPPSYLLVFSNINFPHDYYQLIITPFLAITSATGICWIANWLRGAHWNWSLLAPRFLTTAVCLLTIASPLTYAFWFKWPRLDNRVLEFEKLCAGRFEPWGPAILWSTPEASGQSVNSYLPAFLYAAKLWGYAWTVPDAASAKDSFQEIRPGFERLDYLIFYGTEQPEWVPQEQFHLTVRDEHHRFFVFRNNNQR